MKTQPKNSKKSILAIAALLVAVVALASGESGPYGLFITTVDGETADDATQEWWRITMAGEMLNSSADQTPIADGDRYELTVTTLIIIYTLTYKKKAFFSIYVFVLLEGLIFGFGIWWVSSLYIWSILAVVGLLLQKLENAVLWAVPYLISGGIRAAFAYWTAGIPYDILHCGGNFVLTFVLYKPLFHLIKKFRQTGLGDK